MNKVNTAAKARMEGYICDALISLMETKDYGDISISELCDRAGVSRSTFYRTFKDKEAVMAAYLDQNIVAFLDEAGPVPDSEDDMYGYIVSIFRVTYEHKGIFKALRNSSVSFSFQDIFNRSFVRTFSERAAAMDAYRKYPMLPYTYAGSMYNLIMQWVREDCATDIMEMAGTLFLSIYGHEYKPAL